MYSSLFLGVLDGYLCASGTCVGSSVGAFVCASVDVCVGPCVGACVDDDSVTVGPSEGTWIFDWIKLLVYLCR